MKNILSAFLIVILMAVTVSAQTNWRIDFAHSNIGFSVAHMVVADVVGDFKEFDGTIISPGDSFENTDVELTIKTTSVNTDNEKRDNHLRSSDFFDAEKNPEIKFKSKSFKSAGNNKFKIVGDLTMHGVTKEVTFDATFKGKIKDNRGNTRVGFKATTEIDRYDFDMKYNSIMEAGGLLIGQNLAVMVNLELISN